MWMQVFSAQVICGEIVPDDDVVLPEGARLTVSTDDLAQDGEMSDSEEAEWLESMAETMLDEAADVIPPVLAEHRESAGSAV